MKLVPPNTDPTPSSPNPRRRYKLGVGIDIAARTFTAATCELDETPSKAHNFTQTPEDFIRLEKHLLAAGLLPTDMLVVMEATGTYWIELAIFLDSRGFPLSVINPATARDFAKSLLIKLKNDRIDAQMLARLAITHKPALWTPPPLIYRELTQRLAQRNDLVAMRTSLTNQLHALSVCPSVPSVVSRFDLLVHTIDLQLKELEVEIKTALNLEEEWAASVARLQTIPGVGPLTALWLVVLTLNFTLCTKAESLVQFAGLAPIERRSGTSVRGRPMIGHGGHGPLRSLVYMAAGSAIRFNPLIKAYYEELRLTKGKPYKVARCAAARKLLHIAFAVATHSEPFEAAYALRNRAARLEPKAQAR